MKTLKKIIFALFVSAFLFSCTPQIGWGVILWSLPESQLNAGDLVPVHVKSNITKTFIIGLKNGKKIEIPLWQIDFYEAKGKADAYSKLISPLSSMYALAKTDGLPMRDKPENGSKRVYRLREGQKIKLLQKVKGSVVMSGKEALPGDWYEAMSDDGVIGYVFSYNLAFEDEKTGVVAATQVVETDNAVDVVFMQTWRPEYYKTMIKDKAIDLSKFSLKFGLFPDLLKKQLRLELPEYSQVYNYEDTERIKQNQYRILGADLEVQLKSADSIILTYLDSSGRRVSTALVLVKDDISSLIRNEESRRQIFVDNLLSKGLKFSSDKYGVLSFTKAQRFTWNEFETFVPDFIEEGSSEQGTLGFNVFLESNSKVKADDVITLLFDSQDEESAHTFLFKNTAKGFSLRLVKKNEILNGRINLDSIDTEEMVFTALE